MRIFSRLLHTTQGAYDFLQNVLEYTGKRKNTTEKLAVKIAEIEMQQTLIEGKDTSKSSSYRQHRYANDDLRIDLRNKIYTELITKKHLDDDDKIKLGSGGALPQTEIKIDRQAYIIIGLPASGKSSITNIISNKQGAIIIDSDYAKRKFPEYKTMQCGASVVHSESSLVVMGGSLHSENSVLYYAVKNGYNIVIPKIGDEKRQIVELSKSLKEKKYDVHLILVRLDRVKATSRALERFCKTGRYVPLAMIFDEYSNNPTITFYDLKNNIENNEGKIFKSFTMLSTDVPKETHFKVIYSDKYSPFAKNGEYEYAINSQK